MVSFDFDRKSLDQWREEADEGSVLRLMAEYSDMTREEAINIVTERALAPVGPYPDGGTTILSPLPGPSDGGPTLEDVANDRIKNG